jgi:hypothetical protein
MSLELAAQHLASRGRKGDTMLIHMAPQEVAGLQALAKAAGGTLTVNPDTGLPEANFLKQLLPTLIGAGLSFIPGVGPLMAAGIVGGGTTLATGSLNKGLMAGLGAYGGAGLAGGLKAAAATGVAGTAGVGAGTSAMDAAMAKALPVSSGVAPVAGLGGQTFAQASQAANAAAANQAVNTAMTGALPLSSNAGLAGNTFGLPAAPMTVPPTPSMLSTMRQGIDALGTEAGRTAFLGNAASKGVAATGVGGTSGLLKSGLAVAAPMMMGEGPKQAAYDGGGPNPYQYIYDISRPSNPSYDSREALQLSGRYVPYAAGGPVEEMSDRNAMETLIANGGQMYAEGGKTKEDAARGMTGASADAFRYLMGQASASPATLAAQQTAQPVVAMPSAPVAAPTRSASPFGSFFERLFRPRTAAPQYTFDPATGQYLGGQPMASGGIAALAMGGQSHLGDYSDGGRLLKGPGDGVSDSIPATIADKRPARLADGEFVVPARIVSELGNGSTDAGARKLYAMMDRVQKARGKTTGKNRVAVNSKAERMLPA